MRLTSTRLSAAGRHRSAGALVTPPMDAVLMTSLARPRRPMPRDNEGDYEVGYGKPPLHTRFKQGRSGNPRGRSRDGKNLSTLLNEALNEPVVVTENSGLKRISKLKPPSSSSSTKPPRATGEPSSSWLTFCKTSSGGPNRKPRRARSASRTKRLSRSGRRGCRARNELR